MARGKHATVWWGRGCSQLPFLLFGLRESFLLNFTLEVISEKVAQKMQSYAEEEYQKSRNHEPKG